jgi:hypothetical protein
VNSRAWGVRIVALALLLGVAAARLPARQPRPAPEIFLAEWKNGLASVVNISNNPGFDNQPQFSADGKAVLFASNRDGRQTDIYSYSLRSRIRSRVTESDDSEYWPAPVPESASVSAVRVEAGGAQRLWWFDPRGRNAEVVLPKITPVGGYAWLDSQHVALCVLDPKGGPATLRLADLTTRAVDVLDTNIGRSIARRPKSGEITYLSKATAGHPAVVKMYDTKTRAASVLMPALAGGEDLAWIGDSEMLMVKGSTFFRRAVQADTWTRVPDPPAVPYANVSRMTMSADGRWLAFAADPVTK